MSGKAELEALRALKAARENDDQKAELAALRAIKEIRALPNINSVDNQDGLDLPEFDLPFEFSGRQAKTALGLMTTFDDKRELGVLKENYPDLKFMVDQDENIIVDGTAYGGNVGFLNKPGISFRDIMDVGFQIGAFTPAAGAVAKSAGLMSRATTVGGASAATQAGLDLSNQALGGTDEVSASNIDGSSVALAGIGGGIFEALSPVAAVIAKKFLPFFKGSREATIKAFKDDVAKQTGINIDEITDEMATRWLDAARETTDPAAIPAIVEGGEFGIRFTKGQATGNTKQLALEDSLREGVFDEGAQNVLTSFRQEVQNPSIVNAVDNAQASLSGGKQTIESTAQAGNVVREGIQNRAATLDDSISEAYESVGDAFLSPEGLSGVFKTMKARSRDIEFVRDKALAPATMQTLGDIASMEKTLKSLKGNIRPFHIQRIEQMRRRLGANISSAANPTDKRQVTLLKGEFDRALDAAVDGALFSGDEGALTALKQARSLRTEYAKKFGRTDTRTRSGRLVKDETGDIVERMISANPTDEQVINYFFGANKLGGKRAGAQLSNHIKTQLGEASPEWQAIREAAFIKLTAPTAGNAVTSGKVMLSRIDDATKNSPTMLKTLFSKDEIVSLKRLANAIRRGQPDRLNPSGTAYQGARQIRQLWEGLAQTVGFATGGVTGAVTARAGVEAGKELSKRAATKQARDAAKGIVRPLERLGVGNAGATGGVASDQNVSADELLRPINSN